MNRLIHKVLTVAILIIASAVSAESSITPQAFSSPVVKWRVTKFGVGSNNFTVPADVHVIFVSGCAGGGAGGDGNAAGWAGGGGGPGECVNWYPLPVTPGGAITVSVGTKGVAPSTTATATIISGAGLLHPDFSGGNGLALAAGTNGSDATGSASGAGSGTGFDGPGGTAGTTGAGGNFSDSSAGQQLNGGLANLLYARGAGGGGINGGTGQTGGASWTVQSSFHHHSSGTYDIYAQGGNGSGANAGGGGGGSNIYSRGGVGGNGGADGGDAEGCGGGGGGAGGGGSGFLGGDGTDGCMFFFYQTVN